MEVKTVIIPPSALFVLHAAYAYGYLNLIYTKSYRGVDK